MTEDLAAEKIKLEVEKLRVEVEKEQVELLEALNRVRDWEIKTGYSVINRRVVRLTAGIDDDTVGEARAELYDLARLYPGQPLTLDINSPGGSVFAGMELFGVLRELSADGHQIITRIGGHGASMGGILLQAGDVRQIRKNSYLHIHEVSSGAIGKASEMMESAVFAEKLTREIAEIFASRGAVKTANEIYDRMVGKEWWMNAEEALAEGFVDEIV